MYYKTIEDNTRSEEAFRNDQEPDLPRYSLRNFLQVVMFVLALPILAATGALFSSCNVGFTPIEYPTAPKDITAPEDIYLFAEGGSNCVVSYGQNPVSGALDYKTLNIKITNSDRDNPAGWVLPLARTLYLQPGNEHLEKLTVSFPDMTWEQFRDFLNTTVLGIMDWDSTSTRPDNPYRPDNQVYAPLETRTDVLQERYGITINEAACTITIDLRQRAIVTNNIATDINDFIFWRNVNINGGRANFTVNARPGKSDAAYVGVYLNYDKDPAKNETFRYDAEAVVDYDLSLTDPNAEVILVMTQTDKNGKITGQLNFNLKDYDKDRDGPIQMKHFTQAGLYTGGSASGEILSNGNLRMTLPVDGASVTILEQSDTKFAFNPRTNRDAHIIVDVKDLSGLNFASAVSLGLTVKDSTGQIYNGWTDVADTSSVEDLGLVNGYRRLKISISSMLGFPGRELAVESVSFKNATSNSNSYEIASITMNTSNDASSAHTLLLPGYVDKNGWFGGLGFAILQGSATNGSMGAFKVGNRIINVEETAHSLNSEVMRLSWTTYGSVNYTIQNSDGNFKRD